MARDQLSLEEVRSEALRLMDIVGQDATPEGVERLTYDKNIAHETAISASMMVALLTDADDQLRDPVRVLGSVILQFWGQSDDSIRERIEQLVCWNTEPGFMDRLEAVRRTG